jgi:hypothetical protein
MIERGERRRAVIRRWLETYAKLGWRMFPAQGKKPVINAWPDNATTDLAILERWFRYPFNIGLVAGESFDIFDIEAEHVPAFTRYVGTLPETGVVRTGRGGLHIYVLPTGRKQNAKLILNGTVIGDLRSVRGGALAPPSHTTGPYYWLWSPEEMILAGATDAMLALLPPKPIIRWPARIYSATEGLEKLHGLERAVRTAPVGKRNAILYWAARTGLEEGIPPRYLAPALMVAAQEAGLRLPEIRSTIKSAARAL